MRSVIAIAGLGLVVALAGPASAQDAAAGKTAFPLRCGTCHQVADTKSGITGPSLKGVVGRKVASLGDFNYSTALKAKGGLWTPDDLDTYLSSPVKFAPGGKMYVAVTAPKDRADLIAYLKTVK